MRRCFHAGSAFAVGLALLVTQPATGAEQASPDRGSPLHLIGDSTGVRSGYSGNRLIALGDGKFRFGQQDVILLPGGRMLFHQPGLEGTVTTFKRVPGNSLTPGQLAGIAGHYRSDEAEADFIVTTEAGGLRLTIEQRPGTSVLYKPAYADAFLTDDGMIRVLRGTGGEVTGLRLSEESVWDLRADRVKR